MKSDEEKLRTENLRLRHEIRTLEELNKMLQTNMFHYEYRARDEGMKNIELSCEIDRLRERIVELSKPTEQEAQS